MHARENDFRQEIGSGKLGVFDAVFQLEYVIEIGTHGLVIDEGQILRFGIPDEPLGFVAIPQIFDAAVFVAVVE